MNDVARRNDLGGKLSWLLIAAMLTGFAGISWATAIKGGEKADEALKKIGEQEIEIAVLKTNFTAINYRLDEIKALVQH